MGIAQNVNALFQYMIMSDAPLRCACKLHLLGIELCFSITYRALPYAQLAVKQMSLCSLAYSQSFGNITRLESVPFVSEISLRECLFVRTETHQTKDQEPRSAYKPECGQTSHTEKNNLHVNNGPLLLVLIGIRGVQVVDIRAEDGSCKRQVREYPYQNDAAPEALVVVRLLVLCGEDLDFLRRFLRDDLHLLVVLRVQVTVIIGNVDVDFPARLEVDAGELLRLVVSFRTPRDIVCVAEGVDVEDVEICGRQEEVLYELVRAVSDR